jgi:hypothetical protein
LQDLDALPEGIGVAVVQVLLCEVYFDGVNGLPGDFTVLDEDGALFWFHLQFDEDELVDDVLADGEYLIGIMFLDGFPVHAEVLDKDASPGFGGDVPVEFIFEVYSDEVDVEGGSEFEQVDQPEQKLQFFLIPFYVLEEDLG